MHKYTLHYVVEAECDCCGVPYSTVFKSRSDQVVCKGCLRHQGNDPRSLLLRDRDHKALWASEIALLMEQNQRRLELMQQQCEVYRDEASQVRDENEVLKQAIREGFAGAPHEAVQHWMINEATAGAVEDRSRAYRSRGYAYRALWSANALHHHEPQRVERCSCGKPASGCRELQAIEEMEETLYKWERHQVQRLMDGKDHELPNDHPEVRARPGWERSRWSAWVS